MKTMFRLTMHLIVFLFLFGICHAGNMKESDTDIIGQNDQLIKAVHASGGLVFATPPYWGHESTRIGFKQLAKHLGNAANNNVALIILKDYESLIKRTMAGEVDIGFYGPTLYVATKEAYPELRCLATSIWKTTGKPIYYSYLITRRGSGLLSLESLKGKSFAFGSKKSTGGYMYPMAWMKENNLNPEKYFKSVEFLGSHNNVLDAVAAGRVDAGSVSPGPLAKKTKEYGNVFNRLRKFGPIPSSVVAVGNKMPDGTIKKIVEALTTLPPAVTDVEQFDHIGFKVISDASYDQLRRVIEITNSSNNK
jgi:phosphate/phosphite/phosphonate ABC transporter binding protein